MVADVTTREGQPDANKPARKASRPGRKPAKASSRGATESRQGSRPASRTAKSAKRATRAASSSGPRKDRATAPKRAAGPEPGSAAGAAPRKAITKAGFVRTQALTLPAKDVVTAAAKLGLRMTPDYVHKVRSSTKARDRLAGVSMPSPRAKTLSTGLASAKVPSGPRNNGEAAFRKLVLELGLDRAKRLLADIERRLAPLLR